MSANPRLLHRVYFDDLPPFRDPFTHFEDTWRAEMPSYQIMKYNSQNVDLNANEWMRRAAQAKSPVFMSEFVRWDALRKYGGMYLDADCEILNGAKLHQLIEDMYESDEYDAFIGIESTDNGHPTAQTVGAKPGSALVEFMHQMYSTWLSGPLWHWREERGLIGPQLMSLYFRDAGLTSTKGFFWNLQSPTICGRVKVYTQDYFSPKFKLEGTNLVHTENTCVYHLFSNLNVEITDEERRSLRDRPMRYEEYRTFLRERGFLDQPEASNPLRFVKRLTGSWNAAFSKAGEAFQKWVGRS